MKKKLVKGASIKAKNPKFKFPSSKRDIFQFLQTNTAASILIALVILFIAIGNAFVVGALIGGYLGAKKGEKLYALYSNFPMILGITTGAVIGGIMLVLSVRIGAVFHTIGSILGAIAGFMAIIVFSGDLTEKVTNKLMNLYSSNRNKKNMKTTNKKKG